MKHSMHLYLSQSTHTSTHDLLQQMLNPLVDKDDAAPPPESLFTNITTDSPQVEEEADTKRPPLPLPAREWTETVYTFQDLQTQANLYN